MEDDACSGLSAFASDPARQLDVLGHDGDALRVDRAQVGVFEETDEVGFAGLLQSHDGGALETEIGLEVLCDLTNETLERQLADQQLGTLLVATDLTEGYSAGPVAMGLLDATGGRCALAGSLGGELLPRSLTTGGFTSGLLGTRHCKNGTGDKCNKLLTQKTTQRSRVYLHTSNVRE
jgi:hypothetical protein